MSGGILIIDDDRNLLRATKLALEARGFVVDTAQQGLDGVVQAALQQPDIVVLDLHLPDIDGVEVLRRIREFSEVAVLVLSGDGQTDRRVQLLDLGADDFMAKPFSMAELEARVRSLLRRLHQGEPAAPTEVSCGVLRIDLVHKMAFLDEAPLKLTAKEYELLSYLARNEGMICTHQMVLRDLWGGTATGESQYLWVYANRLRKKLGDWGKHLVTHQGIGYQLLAQVPES